MFEIILVVAVQKKDNGIGKDGKDLYAIMADRDHFKVITIPHPVIMGRKTWEGIDPKYRPLPGRPNIVISRDPEYWKKVPEGVIVVGSLAEAIEKAKELDTKICIIGGGSIYREAMQLGIVDTIEITIIDGDKEGADTFFSEWQDFGDIITEEDHVSPKGLRYSFKRIEKRKAA